MMWLMGLAGLVGAGAASFVVTKTDLETDEGDPDTAPDPMDAPDLISGNMLDDIDGLWGDPDTGEARDSYDENDDYLYDMFGESPAQERYVSGYEDETDGDTMPDWPGDAAPGAGLPDSADLLSTKPESAADEPPVPVMLGDWIFQGAQGEPVDYHAGFDSLILVWDDMAADAGEPDVGVAPDPYDPEVMHVTMNGASVAEIYGEPELAPQDLTVIPLSSAMIAGLAPA